MPDIFSTMEDRTAYFMAYDEMLRHWPEHALQTIETGLGRTNVIEAGDPKLPPLVLLPAVSVSATAWLPVVGMLCRHHHIFALDIVGDAGRSTLTRMPASARDYADWLAECFVGLGLAPPPIMGHSYGGWLTLQVAAHRPEVVGPIIVVSPSSGLAPFHWYAKLALKLAEKLPWRTSARTVLRAQAHRGFELDETFVGLMDAVTRHVRTHVLFPAVLSDEELGAIKSPALILVGENEPLYSPSAAIARARKMRSRVVTRLVPNTSHLLPIERPEALDAAVSEFLAREQASLSAA